MLYLLQAPRPLSTNGSTPKLTPGSFPGFMDARASSYWRSPPLSHCPNTPFSSRAMHRQPPTQLHLQLLPHSPTSSVPSAYKHAPVSSSLKNILVKKKKKKSFLDSISNSLAILCSSSPSFSGDFTQSPLSHLPPTSQFTAVWFALLKQLQDKVISALLTAKWTGICWLLLSFWNFLLLWNTSLPGSLSTSSNHCFCLIHQPLPPHWPPYKVGCPRVTFGPLSFSCYPLSMGQCHQLQADEASHFCLNEGKNFKMRLPPTWVSE